MMTLWGTSRHPITTSASGYQYAISCYATRSGRAGALCQTTWQSPDNTTSPNLLTGRNVTPQKSPNARGPTWFVLEALSRNVTVPKRKLNCSTQQQQSSNGRAPKNIVLETLHKNVTVRERKPPTGSKPKCVIYKKTVSKNKKTRVLLLKPFDGSED